MASDIVCLFFFCPFCVLIVLLDATVEMQKDQRKLGREKKIPLLYIVASNCKNSNEQD